jgi:hypothetical protein
VGIEICSSFDIPFLQVIILCAVFYFFKRGGQQQPTPYADGPASHSQPTLPAKDVEQGRPLLSGEQDKWDQTTRTQNTGDLWL